MPDDALAFELWPFRGRWEWTVINTREPDPRACVLAEGDKPTRTEAMTAAKRAIGRIRAQREKERPPNG